MNKPYNNANSLGQITKGQFLKKIFEHPIIYSVIAGLILYFSTQVDGFWTSIWGFISSIFLKTVSFLQTQINVSLWVVFLVLIVLIFYLVKLFPLIKNKINSRELTDSEIDLLNLAVQKDGQALSYNDITSTLKIKKLEAEQIVEALYELGYIEVYKNNFEGTQIYLTENGRDFILGNKIKGT